jgi:hypothetical protein
MSGEALKYYRKPAGIEPAKNASNLHSGGKAGQITCFLECNADVWLAALVFHPYGSERLLGPRRFPLLHLLARLIVSEGKR